MNEPRPKLYQMRSRARAAGLREMIRATGLAPGFRMAELGCFAGESMAIFVHAGARYFFAVDPWEPLRYRQGIPDNLRPDWAEADFDHRMRALRAIFPELEICKAKTTSQRASLLCRDRSLDLVYIDGLHTFEAVRADIFAWRPKLKRGGWLTGHDIARPAVRDAILATIGREFGAPRIFPDSSWAYRIEGGPPIEPIERIAG